MGNLALAEKLTGVAEIHASETEPENEPETMPGEAQPESSMAVSLF